MMRQERFGFAQQYTDVVVEKRREPRSTQSLDRSKPDDGGWQERFGFVEQMESVPDLPDDVIQASVRRIALHTYLQAIDDAKEGDVEAELWLGSSGRELIDAMGYGILAQMKVSELLKSANSGALREALGMAKRHCRDCAALVCKDGRCRCSEGMWVAQGRREDYAEATVRHDSRGFFKPCGHWRERCCC